MRQDSRPATIARLLSFAKEQLVLARVAGQAERMFHCRMAKSKTSVLALSHRRHWLHNKREAKIARKYVKRTLTEIEIINGQLSAEGNISSVPLQIGLNGQKFHSWGAELAAAQRDVGGEFEE